MRLLSFLLLLLTDADLEHLLLGFLICLMIVTRNRVLDVSIGISVLGQDSHQCETLVANRAERAKALHVRDCHNILRLTQIALFPGGR
jgi:hypothetical protein